MNAGGHSPDATPAGRMTNAPSDPQRPDGEADMDARAAASSSSAIAAAFLADSVAAIAADGDTLWVPQSATAAASDLPQQPVPAPIPFPAAAAAANPAATSAAAAVPMLRCFSQCRDVQFVLMQLLPLTDLAALHAACRSWRQWLLSPPLISGLQFDVTKGAQQVILLSQCDWARPFAKAVRLKSWRRGRAKILLPRAAPTETELAVCDQFLSSLPLFTRLHTLHLSLADAFAATPVWPTCLTALSGTLHDLQLDGERHAAPVNAVLAHVGRLRCLTALTIFVGSDQVARELNLSQLPSLPRLDIFNLSVENEQRSLVSFRCTPLQVQHLSQCSRLTELDCGIWSPDQRQLDDAWRHLPPVEQQIDEGIATLVRGLTLQPVAAAAAASASESASSIAPAAAAPSLLQFLNLKRTDMSAAVWEHVSQLTSLTELAPDHWRADITPQLWSRLSNFKRLETIHIESDGDDDYSATPLRTDDVLPPLLQCTQLRKVCMVGVSWRLSADQMDGIARLPLLRALILCEVEIESVAPLVHAVKLQQLKLRLCRGHSDVIDFRRSLPPLPALTRLTVEDLYCITTEQAAPLHAALFARMPKLTAANCKFKQNLSMMSEVYS